MFRFAVAAALCALAQPLFAESPAGADETDRQRMMMQGLQQMQACMANLDHAAMEHLGKEGEALTAEIKALCKDGKRDEAQEKAMAFGKKMAKDPTMKAMAACGEHMQGMLPQPPAATEEELKKHHVCDQP